MKPFLCKHNELVSCLKPRRKGADLSPRAVAERQAQFVQKHKKKPVVERIGNRFVSPKNYKRPVDKFEVAAEG